ncbi:MAG: hypothetical protein IPJ84_17380 [Bdellovibrionales bacterium]|nr:hypothetical protein [Bdellovibrionales bacterium]
MRLFSILAALTLLVTTQAFATDELSGELRAERRGWQCTAHGKISTGTPAGDIWQTVTGFGPTEFEAMHNAIQMCHTHGLQMCMSDFCYKLR